MSVKLQKSTWRHNTRIWKSLLGFVIRTSQPDCDEQLRHQLPTRQTISLNKMMAQAQKLVDLSGLGEALGEDVTSAIEQASDDRDIECLEFCIALLDHDLEEDFFESAIVDFFAAFAIDPAKGILKEAYHFTPILSGSIKVAQMLVIQKCLS
jgi:hypothetical protein